MRSTPFAALIALSLFAFTCKPRVSVTPPSATASAELVALSGASVMIGAGDIAACDYTGDEATATLVDSVLRADEKAKVQDVVFTLGDNAYSDGTAEQFANCFGHSWGDTAKLIMKRIRPSPGNHEHQTKGAAPYYAYFGKAAGPPSKGYYSYDLGEWHIIALNSEIIVNSEFLDADRKAEEDWLQADLKANSKKCTLAYWHHPRFSSGWHGSDVRIEPFWRLLYEAGADVVLNGHDHNYERFAAQTPEGVADTTKGIVQFVVGTGGDEPRGFAGKAARNSMRRIEGHNGVLKLTLGASEYQYAFLEPGGRVWDPGKGACH